MLESKRKELLAVHIPDVEIIDKIGSGASSDVYSALYKDKKIALKLLKTDSEFTEVKERQYRREISSLACLRHPSIARILHSGRIENSIYIIMEYVNGHSLNNVIKNGTLSNEKIISIAKSLGGALNEIHQRGFIHRDIKPENIIIAEAGETKLIDFGLISRTDSTDQEVAGTLSYMAPEQLGIIKNREIDSRTDLYSLGVVLFECAIGKKLFEEVNPLEFIKTYLNISIPKIQDYNPEINPILCMIIEKLISKEPDDRYYSAQSLLNDIENIEEFESKYKTDKNISLGSFQKSLFYQKGNALVGRGKELEKLQKVFSEAKSGFGSIVIVEGESGLGKSRLCEELIRIAYYETSVIMRGKCEKSSALPFEPFQKLIESYLDYVYQLPDSEKFALIDNLKNANEKMADLLIQVVPVINKIFDWKIKINHERRESSLDQNKFCTLLAEFVLKLPEIHNNKTLTMYLDDIQWIDESSLEVIKKISDEIKKSPFLLLVTSRKGDSYNNALELFANTTKNALSQRIAINPLTPDEVSHLIKQFLIDTKLPEDMFEYFLKLTKGNPYLVNEYMRAMFDSGVLRFEHEAWAYDNDKFENLILPANAMSLVVDRINILDKETISVLKIAAIIGLTFDKDLLLTITGYEPDYLINILNRGIQENLLTQINKKTYRFFHDKINEFLIESISDIEKRKIHKAIAENLDRGKEISDNIIYRLAYHYANGTRVNLNRIFETNYEAGQNALKIFANLDAYKFFQTAITFIDQIKISNNKIMNLYIGLGQACKCIGKSDESINNLRFAFNYTKEKLQKAKIYTTMIETLILEFRFDEIEKMLVPAFEALEKSPPSFSFKSWCGAFAKFFYVYILKIFGVAYSKAKGQKREKMILLCKMYWNTTLYYIFTNKTPLCLQLALNQYYYSYFIGLCHESVYSYISIMAVSSHLGFKKTTIRAYNNAISISTQIRAPELVICAKLNYVSALYFLGFMKERDAFAKKIYMEDKKWIVPFELIRSRCSDIHNLANRGYNDEALDILYETLNEILKIPQQSPVNYFLIFTMISTTNTVKGDLIEANNALKKTTELLAIIPNYPIIKIFDIHTNLFCMLETEELNNADRLISDFESLQVNSSNLFLMAQYIYLRIAEIRFCQYERSNLCPISRKLFLNALKMLSRLSFYHIFVGNVLLLKGSLNRIDKKYTKAYKNLLNAEKIAFRQDSPRLIFDINREIARIAKLQGDEAQCKSRALYAYSLAKKHNWHFRIKKICNEFSIEDLRKYSSENTSVTSDTISNVSMHRYADSLLRVSLASTLSFDFNTQIQLVLDEIISLLNAQRAFLFLYDNTKEKLIVQAGRDNTKNDLTDLTGYSNSIITQVWKTKKPVLIADPTKDISSISESIMIQKLMSILAVPLVLRDKYLGVIYIDNQDIKGLFSEEDIEIFKGIAGHIAIAIETARAAKLEIEKASLEKDLEVSSMVQSLLLPKENMYESQNIKLASYYKSASRSGGDWWWFERLSEHRYRLIIGDVTGHGVGAAMVTAVFASSYQLAAISKSFNSSLAIVEKINEVFVNTCQNKYWMTLTLLDIDLKESVIDFTSAGSPPFFIMDESGKIDLFQNLSNPIGCPEPKIASQQITLINNKKYRIFVFTDGANEMTLPDGKQFGMRKLKKLFQSTNNTTNLESCKIIETGLEEVRQTIPLDDDICFAVLDIDNF